MNAKGTTNNAYRGLSLHDLLRRIVDTGDEAALAEFHNHRRVFMKGDAVYRFADFVEVLVQASHKNHSRRAMDFARDMLTDRFCHLEWGNGGCRRCFSAALDGVDSAHPLAERALCLRLSGLARRHFRFALKEAYRSGERSRFVWRKDGVELVLLFPVEISGTRRSQWLERHAGGVDWRRADARKLVQAIIDEELGCSMTRSLDADGELQRSLAVATGPDAHADSIGVVGLAAALADEKAKAVSDQRPAIRRLGARSLRALVLAIMDDIADGRYEERRIAETFDISPPTLSRFAGHRWKAGSGGMPDLWRNLAQLLAFDPRFAPLCREAGLVDFLMRNVSD